jgi:xylan 1,4-beta-xylosidase
VRERPDVGVLASRDDRQVTVLAWHYHDDDVPGPAAAVSLAIEGLGAAQGTAQVQHFRVDAEHGNAYAAWLRMGSPQEPSPAQYAELEQGRAMVPGLSSRAMDAGRADVAFTLPRQGVSLLVVRW